MNQTFAAVGGPYTESQTETSGAAAGTARVCAHVSPPFFLGNGTPALIGRTFAPDEDLAGRPGAAVICGTSGGDGLTPIRRSPAACCVSATQFAITGDRVIGRVESPRSAERHHPGPR